MRLRQYATKMGVSYKTAFRWWKAGKLDAYRLDTGTVKERAKKIQDCVEHVIRTGGRRQ